MAEERSLHDRARLRVLLVTSNFPRWDDDSTTPFVLHLAQDLQAIGLRVDVLAPHAPGAASRERLGGVEVSRFRYLWPESAETVCYGGGALINLRQDRSNLAKVPFLVMAELAVALRRLGGGRYHLINSHWALPQGFVGAVSGRLRHVPHVLTVHGGDIFAMQGRGVAPFKRYALQHADAVTVNSSVTRRAVLEAAPRARDVRVIPMGIAERPVAQEEAALVRSRFRRGDGPLLLFVGRLVEEKGLDDLLHALPILARRLPDVSAVVVGEGQDRHRLELLTRELHVEDRVSFAGWVQPEAVPNLLAAGDVFVAPSRRSPQGWVEAQGLSVLEAMAAGLPVVASRSGGLIDVVVEGETGLLVSERAAGEIAIAVERICTDAELRAKLQEHARLMAARFSRPATARAFADLFQELSTGARPQD